MFPFVQVLTAEAVEAFMEGLYRKSILNTQRGCLVMVPFKQAPAMQQTILATQ